MKVDDAGQRARGAGSGALPSLLARVHGMVAVLLFVLLTIVVGLQVLTRFVLHLPLIWSEEAARFLFFWVVLLGAAMSVRTRRHFVLDIAMGSDWTMRRSTRLLLDLIPQLCVAGFSLFLLVQGIAYARAGLLRTATNSQINMGLVYVAIPVFAALSIVYSAVNMIADWKSFLVGRTVEHERPASAE